MKGGKCEAKVNLSQQGSVQNLILLLCPTFNLTPCLILSTEVEMALHILDALRGVGLMMQPKLPKLYL